MKKIVPAVLFILFFACNNADQPNSKLILGTWNFENSPEHVQAKFIFDAHTLVYKTTMFADTVEYKFSADEKTLITTEKTGRVDEVSILKLSSSELVMLPKKENDTLLLERR